MRRTALLVSMLAGAAFVLGACASASSSAGASAATSPSAANTTVAGSIDAASAPFVGSKKSKRYYPAACQTVQLIKVAERVGFGSMKDAEAAGFTKDVYSTDCRY